MPNELSAPGWLRDFARFCYEKRGFPAQAVIAFVQQLRPVDQAWFRVRWIRSEKKLQDLKAATRLSEIKNRKTDSQLRAKRQQRIVDLKQQLGQLQEMHRDATTPESRQRLEDAIRRWTHQLNEVIAER